MAMMILTISWYDILFKLSNDCSNGTCTVRIVFVASVENNGAALFEGVCSVVIAEQPSLVFGYRRSCSHTTCYNSASFHRPYVD